ncbi:hypothetical protein KIPB_006267, partial [Kipferlia bialata]
FRKDIKRARRVIRRTYGSSSCSLHSSALHSITHNDFFLFSHWCDVNAAEHIHLMRRAAFLAAAFPSVLCMRPSKPLRQAQGVLFKGDWPLAAVRQPLSPERCPLCDLEVPSQKMLSLHIQCHEQAAFCTSASVRAAYLLHSRYADIVPRDLAMLCAPLALDTRFDSLDFTMSLVSNTTSLRAGSPPRGRSSKHYSMDPKPVAADDAIFVMRCPYCRFAGVSLDVMEYHLMRHHPGQCPLCIKRDAKGRPIINRPENHK